MSTLNIVAQPDGLRKGITISVQSVCEILVPESTQADESRLLTYKALLRGSPQDDVKNVFRSRTKEERQAGKTIAPLVEQLMQVKGMAQASAANRASEAKAIFNAYLQGLEVKSTRWHEAVAESRKYLEARKVESGEKRLDAMVGERFATLKRTQPEADVGDLFNAAKAATEEEVAVSEQDRALDRLDKMANKLGYNVVPMGETAAQCAERILTNFGKEYASNVQTAIGIFIAEQRDVIEGEHTVVEVAEMPKETETH